MITFHKHPAGARFVRREAANNKPVNLAKWISRTHAANGWHSWQDVDSESADFGLWVLFNVAEGKTYVERRSGCQVA